MKEQISRTAETATSNRQSEKSLSSETENQDAGERSGFFYESGWHQQNLKALKIQPALEIGKEDDVYEKEANQVADKVMRMPEKEKGNEEKIGEGSIQRKKNSPMTISKMSDGNGGGMVAPAAVEQGISSSKGGGQPLPGNIQLELGEKMDADLSEVKIHADGTAEKMNEEIGAKAFTHGKDIYFNEGQYEPSSHSGKNLLAHELTHTIQQSGTETIRRQPKVEKNYTKGTELQDDLRKKPFMEALNNANVEFLLKQTLGKNILEDLSIDKPSKSHKISLLSAGSLAFTFGMLKQRQDYMEQNYTRLERPVFGKGSANDPKKKDDSYRKSARIVITNQELAEINSIADKDQRVKRKQELIDLLAWNPDMPGDAKEDLIKIVAGSDSELNKDIYDTKFQAEVTDLIKVNSDPFFKAMLNLQWVSLEGVSQDMQKMPDQMLAAVGNMGTSTGIAKTPDPYGIGLGYFMYSKEYINNDSQRRGIPRFKKTISVDFPSTGDLVVLMSAYGFDPARKLLLQETVEEAEHRNAPMLNAKPTKVTITNGETVLCAINFYRDHGHNVSGLETETVKSILPNNSFSFYKGAATVTIPATYKTPDGIKFITQTQEVVVVTSMGYGQAPEKRYYDEDEVQIQFSSSGSIKENKTTKKEEIKIDKEKKDDYKIGDKFVLENIYFDTDKSELLPKSNDSLDKLIKILNDHPTMEIEISGHTDSEGDDDYNQKLSEDRAKAVVDYLVQNGINTNRLSYFGYGEKQPIAANDTPEGRQQNRRVEFKVIKP